LINVAFVRRASGLAASHQVNADVKPVGSAPAGIGADPNNPPPTLLKRTVVG
jgi:hypothetical protein